MTKLLKLILPPNDDNFQSLRDVYNYLPPPTSLEILASYISSEYSNLKIEILDGNSESYEEITKEMKADFIGISDWYSNHKNAMELAKTAKIQNPDSLVIIGGPNATNLGRRILINREYVDYVVCGDGEEALLKIIEGAFRDSVPNIWHRDKYGRIYFTFNSTFNINKLPLFSLNHLINYNVDTYNSKLPSYIESFDLSPIPISSVRGCIKAFKEGPCEFCAIPKNVKTRVMHPAKVWDQIKYLYNEYGIKKFFETGDDFSIGNYPEKLLQSKPEDLDITLRVYANLEELNDKKINTLSRLGVNEVFIGIESLDESVLSRANKKINPESIGEIISCLKNRNINAFLSFIYGLPGETTKSLEKTTNFILKLLNEHSNIKHILLSVGVPLIGTKWFDTLMNDKEIEDQYFRLTGSSLFTSDNLDYENLFLLSLRKYSSISLDFILHEMDRVINSDTDVVKGSFGCLENKLSEKSALVNNISC